MLEIAANKTPLCCFAMRKKRSFAVDKMRWYDNLFGLWDKRMKHRRLWRNTIDLTEDANCVVCLYSDIDFVWCLFVVAIVPCIQFVSSWRFFFRCFLILPPFHFICVVQNLCDNDDHHHDYHTIKRMPKKYFHNAVLRHLSSLPRRSLCAILILFIFLLYCRCSHWAPVNIIWVQI